MATVLGDTIKVVSREAPNPDVEARIDAFIEYLKGFGLDASQLPSTIAEQAVQLSVAQREAVLETTMRHLRDPEVAMSNDSGVPAKVFVGLLPFAGDQLLAMLKEWEPPHIYEVHFALFCHLDDVVDIPGASEIAEALPSLIEEYLLEIDTEEASAASKAGDLLGRYWDVDESLPVLMRVFSNAKHTVGRNAAVLGLGEAIRRLADEKPMQAEEIRVLLERAAKQDPDSKVRVSARLMLEFFEREKRG